MINEMARESSRETKFYDSQKIHVPEEFERKKNNTISIARCVEEQPVIKYTILV